MKFPRTIRLDTSDAYAFHAAAEPGEWAVPGGFAFADRVPEDMDGKEQVAFRNGWLGTESFAWSSLVEVAEIDEAGFFQVVERLARHFVEQYGAPDLAAALPVAREEADYAAGLADHPVNTLLSVERSMDETGIRESFRVIQPSREQAHAKIWEFDEDSGPGD